MEPILKWEEIFSWKQNKHKGLDHNISRLMKENIEQRYVPSNSLNGKSLPKSPIVAKFSSYDATSTFRKG